MSFANLLSRTPTSASAPMSTSTFASAISNINVTRPIASGAIYAGATYGVKKLLNEPTQSILSKETLISGGIQAASSLASEQLQPTIQQFAPPVVTSNLGTMMKPATTATLNLGVNLLTKKGGMPPFSDMALMFGISAAADAAADRIIQ